MHWWWRIRLFGKSLKVWSQICSWQCLHFDHFSLGKKHKKLTNNGEYLIQIVGATPQGRVRFGVTPPPPCWRSLGPKWAQAQSGNFRGTHHATLRDLAVGKFITVQNWLVARLWRGLLEGLVFIGFCRVLQRPRGKLHPPPQGPETSQVGFSYPTSPHEDGSHLRQKWEALVPPVLLLCSQAQNIAHFGPFQAVRSL